MYLYVYSLHIPGICIHCIFNVIYPLNIYNIQYQYPSSTFVLICSKLEHEYMSVLRLNCIIETHK